MTLCLLVTCCLSWSHEESLALRKHHHFHHWHPPEWCAFGWTASPTNTKACAYWLTEWWSYTIGQPNAAWLSAGVTPLFSRLVERWSFPLGCCSFKMNWRKQFLFNRGGIFRQCCQLSTFIARFTNFSEPITNFFFHKQHLATNPTTFSTTLSICE